jgi:hypothetical protein
LWEHAVKSARERGCHSLQLESDPHAERAPDELASGEAGLPRLVLLLGDEAEGRRICSSTCNTPLGKRRSEHG